MDWDSVVKPQRTDGHVEAQTDAPVVAEIIQLESEGIALDIADVVEDGEPHAAHVLLLHDRDAVFSGGKPVSVAANRLGEETTSGRVRFARADAVIPEAAQRIQTAQIIPVVEGHGVAVETIG